MPAAGGGWRSRRCCSPITDAEWIVMKAIWEAGPLTTNQIVAALAGRTQSQPKTIRTLLSRLAHNGALAFENKGREYLFRPLVCSDE